VVAGALGVTQYAAGTPQPPKRVESHPLVTPAHGSPLQERVKQRPEPPRR
jgi:hypothetical protein